MKKVLTDIIHKGDKMLVGYLANEILKVTLQYINNNLNEIRGPKPTPLEIGALPDTTVIPSKVSLLINDSNFLTLIPAGYATEDWVLGKNYLTLHLSLDSKLDKLTESQLAVLALDHTKFLTLHQSLEGKQDKLTAALIANLNTDLSQFLTQHQDISGKLDKLTEALLANLNADHSKYLTLHLSLDGKQDVIPNLETIIANAALGATALQSFTETDPTVPAWAKEATKPSYTAQEVGALPSTTYIPTKVSDLANDSNYTTTSDLTSAIAGITSFEYSILEALPESGVKGTIYLISKDGETNDIYLEYLWINNIWELIGTTKVDISNCILKSTTVGLIKNDGSIDTNNYLTVTTLQNVTGKKTFTNGLITNTIDSIINGTGFSSTTNLLNNNNVCIRANNNNPFFGLKQGSNKWYMQAYLDKFYFGPTSTNALFMDLSGNGGVVGTWTANSIIKEGGTSSLFLKADGSVDSNTYLTQHQDISSKIDKVEGKGLSTNDYTSEEKTKLAGIEEGALVNVLELFICTYNVTTFDEIKQALNNGKLPVLDRNNPYSMNMLFSWVQNPNSDFEYLCFTAIRGANPSYNSCAYVRKNNTWNCYDTLLALLSKITDGSVTKVGKVDVGSASLPIYLSGGTPTAGNSIPTKVSELTNDSGYLTLHLDISGKLDKSTLETDVKAFINSEYITSLFENGDLETY